MLAAPATQSKDGQMQLQSHQYWQK